MHAARSITATVRPRWISTWSAGTIWSSARSAVREHEAGRDVTSLRHRQVLRKARQPRRVSRVGVAGDLGVCATTASARIDLLAGSATTTPKTGVVPLDIILYRLFKDHGLTMHNRIVWHFKYGLHSSKRFSGRYETIMWCTKGKDYTFNLDPVRVPAKWMLAPDHHATTRVIGVYTRPYRFGPNANAF